MKINIRFFFTCFLAIIIFSPASWATDDNEIKYWLGGQSIVVEKGIIYDTKERINSSNITDLKTINHHTELDFKTSKKTIVVRFGYNYKDKLILCDATIAYSWLTRCYVCPYLVPRYDFSP